MERLRPVSRRPRRRYGADRTSGARTAEVLREREPQDAQTLRHVNQMSSALRRSLKAHGIDVRMARLVLLFYGTRPLRPSQVAWMLNVSRSTASRYLDRAEALGLVDKVYWTVGDRRATDACITERGRSLRTRVQQLLAAADPADSRLEYGYGRRAVDPYDP